MKKINYLFILMLTIIVASCEPKYEKEYNWAYPVAGDWTVGVYVDGEVVPGYEKLEIKSYNSAFGKDSIWIDDYGTSTFNTTTNKWVITPGHFWTMKYKLAVNVSDKTFGNGKNGTDSVYVNAIGGYDIGIKAMNGKIVGNDSIYFEIQFEDDTTPFGTTYQIAGHRTTSYDEYMGH